MTTLEQTQTAEKKEHCDHLQECMKMVQMIVDGEASQTEIDAFKANMHKCGPCERGFELETCLKEALKMRLDKKCVSANLFESIKQKIGIA
jgi:hypothetical protein